MNDAHAQRTSTHAYLADLVWQMQQHWPDNRIVNIMSWVNHPNRAGYGLVADELMRWFVITRN